MEDHPTAVRAELRALHSPDMIDLQGSRPADPAHFGILVQALVGPVGEQGEESFDFVVCTPTWLAEEATRQSAAGFWFARNVLVLDHYDYETLRRAIADLCQRSTGPTWSEVATKLSRYGAWEFEDYRE